MSSQAMSDQATEHVNKMIAVLRADVDTITTIGNRWKNADMHEVRNRVVASGGSDTQYLVNRATIRAEEITGYSRDTVDSLEGLYGILHLLLGLVEEARGRV